MRMLIELLVLKASERFTVLGGKFIDRPRNFTEKEKAKIVCKNPFRFQLDGSISVAH